KFLSERWFEEAYRTMLNWGKVSGMGIKGYDENSFEYEIPASDIDPERIYSSTVRTDKIMADVFGKPGKINSDRVHIIKNKEIITNQSATKSFISP
ncbi:hypothetical protein LCGC14_2929810, partial [marine sediment metagenome]